MAPDTSAGDEDRYELFLSGEIDLDTVPEIEQQGIRALTDPAVVTLAIDLSDVTFIDSTGIGTLIRLRLTADEHHKHLVLCHPSDAVGRVLTITALAATFTIDDSPRLNQPT